ncbi:MAG: phenylacetate-CoA oxygenase subunit PaaC [Cryobacterium sp.]|nr:phenylacetate-CoA oxygenase subunit PaaC [Cryobacterium sp.]MBX3103464.1 phenylacetate-CoA oxygenase subunit PaaC [Cryobacterium sp.]
MSETSFQVSIGEAFTAEDISETVEAPSKQLAKYAMRLGDDALILAQRLGWWVARAPELEEDVALCNIALDQLGHARAFLSFAGLAWAKTEDDLAYFRNESEFTNAQVFEQPNGDFAQTIARQFVVSNYQCGLYIALQASANSTIAAISAKAAKEVDYHRDHARQWMLRLALGTDESRKRIIEGLNVIWPFVDELFRDDELVEGLGASAVPPSSLRADFDKATLEVLARCEMEVPQGFVARGGGRQGIHTEFLGPLLAEMQVLARAHPGATW